LSIIIQHLSVAAIWSASTHLSNPMLAFRVGGTAKQSAGNYQLNNALNGAALYLIHSVQ